MNPFSWFTADGRRVRRGIACGLAGLVWAAAGSYAAGTWDGEGSTGNWTEGANWVGNSTATSGSSEDVTFGGSTNLNSINDYAGYVAWRSILFNGTAGNFNLTSITGANWDLYYRIQNDSANTQTLYIDAISLQGTAGEFNPIAGDLNINATDIYNNAKPIYVFGTAGKILTFGSGTNISGTGSFTIRENSVVRFQSTQAYTGNTVINAGRLELTSSTAGVAGTLELGNTTGSDAAELRLTPSGGGIAEDAAIFVRSGSSGVKTINSTNTSGTNTLSGGITLNNGVTFAVSSGGNLHISGAITGSNNLVKSGSGMLTLSSASNAFITSGAAGIDISGGTLAFSADANLGNTANDITLNGGTLSFTAAANVSLNSGRVITLGSGNGVIRVESGANRLEVNSVISGGTYILTKTGSGELRLRVGGSHNMVADIQAGTLALQANSGSSTNTILGLTGNSGTTIRTQNGASRTININTAALTSYVFAGTLVNDGTTNLQKSGDGIQMFTGTVGHSGTTSVNGGTLVLSGSKTGGGAVSISAGATLRLGNGGTGGSLNPAGALTNSGTLTFNRSNTVVQGIDFSGSGLSGTGHLIQAGTGNLVLSSANSYTGTTQIQNGTLMFQSLNSLYNGDSANWTLANITVSSGGTLAVSAGNTTVGNSPGNFTATEIDYLLVTLGGNATNGFTNGSILGIDTTHATLGNFAYGTAIANTHTGGANVLGLTKLGTGNLILTANSTYNGTTRIEGGSLVIGNNGTTGRLAPLGTIINNGTLAFNRSSNMTQGTDFTSAAITGTGGIVQTGGGRTQLTGAVNTFSGATLVEEGTLEALGNGTLGSTASINITGGTLLLNKSGGGNSTIVNNAAGITLGNSSGSAGILKLGEAIDETVGVLTLSGNSTIDLYKVGAGSVIRFADSSAATWTGNLSIHNWLQGGGTNTRIYFGTTNGTLTSGQLSQIEGFSGAGTGSLGAPSLADDGELIFSPIPEPGTVAVVLLLGLFLAWRERRTLGVLVFRSRPASERARCGASC